MRQIRYPLPEGAITTATADAVQAVLKEGVPGLAAGSSPMFQTLSGYSVTATSDRASVMRDYLDDLSLFQAAARAVRLEPKGDQRARARALQQRYASKPPIIASIALEVLYVLRDCAEWQDALDYIANLPPALAKLPVVVEQRCLIESKSGNHRTAIAALEELVKTHGPSAERMGLIGGRYKKLAAEQQDPREKARLLSAAIVAYEGGMATDLNAYYPSSNLPRLYRQRGGRGDDDRARAAAVVAMAACVRAKTLGLGDEWLRPTLLGMAFDAGDARAADDVAEEVAREGAAAWKLKTTLDDLEVSVRQQVIPDTKERLEAVLAQLKALL